MELSEFTNKVKEKLDIKKQLEQKHYDDLMRKVGDIVFNFTNTKIVTQESLSYLNRLPHKDFKECSYYYEYIADQMINILVSRIDEIDSDYIPNILDKLNNPDSIKSFLNQYKKRYRLSERAIELFVIENCKNAKNILSAYHGKEIDNVALYSRDILFEIMDEMIRGNKYDYKSIRNFLYKIELSPEDRQIFNNKMEIITHRLFQEPKKMQPRSLMEVYLVLVAKQSFDGVLGKNILENVNFKKLGSSVYGLYNGREIKIADSHYPRTLEGNLHSLNTIFHEGRHAYQRERMFSEDILDFTMENLRMVEEELLEVNVPYYYKNCFNYFFSNQQEADARAHGDIDLYKFIKKENPTFAKKFLERKLNDYKKNNRIKKQHRIFKGRFSPIPEDSTNFFTRTVSKSDIARSRNFYPILRIKYDEDGNLRPLEKLIEVYMDLDKRIKVEDKTTLQYRKDITLYKLYLELIKDYMLRTKNTNRALINRSTRDQVEDFLSSNGRGR